MALVGSWVQEFGRLHDFLVDINAAASPRIRGGRPTPRLLPRGQGGSDCQKSIVLKGDNNAAGVFLNRISTTGTIFLRTIVSS